MDTLTKKSEVLAVIKAGGKVRRGHRQGLVALVDKDGHQVPAWQTAIKSAVAQLAKGKGKRVTARAVTDHAGQSLEQPAEVLRGS